jgi:hypothetical protein
LTYKSYLIILITNRLKNKILIIDNKLKTKDISMKRITFIGLTLLGILPLSAQENDHFLSPLHWVGDAAEQNFDALGDPRLETLGNPLQAIKYRLRPLAKQTGQGLLNLANRYPSIGMAMLAAGSVIVPCAASYLWGKLAKPKSTASKLHKGIYTTVACAIPFILPTVALAAQQAERWAPGKMIAMLATLTAYPMGMIGSYIGHTNA